MEMKYKNIILRDMRESDIDDEIRWNTVETAWALWDAPWEMEEYLRNFDPEKHRLNALKELGEDPDEPRWGFEIDYNGIHIGSVNSYCIDENWDWISVNHIKPGQKVYRAIGIEINESHFWSRGIGPQALMMFIRYLLENGIGDICLQTWSGNARMMGCARKLGFEECHRETGNRIVRGGTYDGMTFLLDTDRFAAYLAQNP